MKPCRTRFPNSFLDYIPDPQLGREEYRRLLGDSQSGGESGLPPLHALLKVTERCQGGCAYCSHAGVVQGQGEASTEELRNAIRQFKDAGVVSVNLTGGEPLLRPDIGQLAGYARQEGLFTILLTNGLLLASRADEIVQSGANMVIISIDSLDRAANESTRGSGVRQVLAGIEKLQLHGKNAPVITTTAVITENNVDHLCGMAEHFSARGVGIEFTPYHHYDRRVPDTLTPSDEAHYRQVVESLRGLKRSGYGILNSDAYLAGIPDFVFCDKRLPDHYVCHCGQTTVFVDATLNVRACWSYGLPVLGNLRRRQLSTILRGRRARAVRERIRTLRCDRCWLLCTAEISLQWR